MDSEDRSTQKDTSSSAVTSSLSDLIARLEKAVEGSRDLDVDICLQISDYSQQEYRRWLGLQPKGTAHTERDFLHARLSTRYTSSIDAAMTLALSGWIVESMSDEATGCVGELVITGCAVEVTNGSFTEQCIAATRPLATAGAWLKARSLPAI